MTILLLTIASIFFSYFVSMKSQNHKRTFLILAGIFVVLIMGSRYFENGFTDEVTYNYVYQGFREMSFKKMLMKHWGERDFGFNLFYWGMAQIIPYKQFPIYFITFLFVFASFRFIYKNSNEPLISVLLIFAFGIFSFYMAGYRQCFAMCFCLFGFEYAKRRKFIRYIILWLLAFWFHASAIIFLPVYWIVNLKNDKKGRIWTFILILLLFATYNILIEYASEWFAKESYEDKKEFSLIGFIIQLVIMAVPYVLYMLNVCEKSEGNTQFVLLALTLIGMAFYVLKLEYYAFERISYYYSFFIVGSFPNTTALLRVKNNRDKSVIFLRFMISFMLVCLCLWRMTTDLTFFWNH